MTRDWATQMFTLFAGRRDCYGLGRGEVVRQRVTSELYAEHLRGSGSGLGIFPLRDDGTVRFAAVDLDRPDFDFARQVAGMLPGETWIERSRSGNAHVWTFFDDDAPAWIVRGVMKAALEAAGDPRVEVFPKQDYLREGMLGNYINLPYHGKARPILDFTAETPEPVEMPWDLFIFEAGRRRTAPDAWRKRAAALGVEAPRDDGQPATPFGERADLHECAAYIIEGALDGTRPLVEGHRSVVLFNLAKMLLNWRGIDAGEARRLVDEVNNTSDRPLPRFEINRLMRNAQRGYTSTGCDDPVMAPYVNPECPIAKGEV